MKLPDVDTGSGHLVDSIHSDVCTMEKARASGSSAPAATCEHKACWISIPNHFESLVQASLNGSCVVTLVPLLILVHSQVVYVSKCG